MCKVLLALITVLLIAGCETDLYVKISEQEANEMVSVLMRNNISARKEMIKSEANVKVEENDFAQAVELLKQAGFPREKFAGMGEVFKGEGLISSPTEERARFIYAISQELANTINDIDGVLQARVHVVVPEANSPLQDPKPASASVFIRYRPGMAMEHLTSQIKMLTTNAIEGLVYDKVTVIWSEAAPVVDTLQSANGGDLIKVAGAWVHPSSASSLQMTFTLLGILAAMGVGFSLYLYWALNRAESQIKRYRKIAMASRNESGAGQQAALAGV